MKKTTFLKTLLMAVGLLMVGANAWGEEGDEIYSNDFSANDQTDFATWTAQGKKPSGYSYAQIGRAGSFSISTGALVWSASTAKNNGYASNASVGIFNSAITTATESNYVLEFDVTIAVQNITGKYFCEISDEDKKVIICIYGDHTRSNSSSGSTVYGYIVGGDNGFQVVEAGASSGTNAEGTIGNGTKVPLTGAISEAAGSKTYHVKLDAKTALGTATLTIKEGEATIVDGVSVNINANSGLKYMCFEGINNYGTASSATLDNLSIVEGAASVETTAGYTVKYVATINDVETEIKDADATRIGVVDETVSITDDDKATIWYNSVKYLYSSDDASTTTIESDGSSVIKVSFTEAPTYTYSISDNLGNTLASGSNYKGETVNYYWPAVRNISGTLYTAPAVSSQYKGSITLSANTEVTPVTYTASETVKNLVFLAEGEDILTESTTNSADTRCSMGKAGYATEAVGFVTLPAGTYKLVSSTRGNSNGDGNQGVAASVVYTQGSAEGTEILSQTTFGYNSISAATEFTLAESSTIYVRTSANNKLVDYLYIYCTAVPATITSAGWATFSSAYDLDFTTPISGLTAYKATSATASSITLDEVNSKVKAGDGLVIKGTAGTYTIPVTTGASTIYTTPSTINMWGYNGNETETVSKAVSGTNFVLSVQSGDVVFAPIGETSATLNPGQAALWANVTISEARALKIVFADDETTGIADVRSKMSDVRGDFFDLQGRKVAQPAKGLYIVNGKKVVIK